MANYCVKNAYFDLFLLFFDAIAPFGRDVDYLFREFFDKKIAQERNIAPERWHGNPVPLQAFFKP